MASYLPARSRWASQANFAVPMRTTPSLLPPAQGAKEGKKRLSYSWRGCEKRRGKGPAVCQVFGREPGRETSGIATFQRAQRCLPAGKGEYSCTK